MGRRHDRSQRPSQSSDFELERTLAAAEEDEGLAGEGAIEPSDTRCLCGCNEFLLGAFLHVVDGKPKAELVDVETLSCPSCGKEYEAVQVEDGRVVRGELLGTVEIEEG